MEGDRCDIHLPSTWVGRLEPGSVQRSYFGLQETVYTARLADAERTKVVIKEVSENSEEAQRELKMSQRLTSFAKMGYSRSRGHIQSHYDMLPLPGATYILTEAADTTLDKLLQQHSVPLPGVSRDFHSRPAASSNTKKALDLKSALPIWIDILRGLAFLDDAGICHGGFAPESVILKDGRALIDNIGNMCYVFDDSDPQLTCSACRDSSKSIFEESKFGISATLQAPEIEKGCPTGPPDHAWTAALMFAMMRFGYNPAERIVAEDIPEWTALRLHDMLSDGRDDIREIIRDDFEIEEDPGFVALGKDEQELLVGMLDKNPTSRWTAKRALEAALQMAERHKIAVPAEREPPTLPFGPGGQEVVTGEPLGAAATGALNFEEGAWE